jgi:predicted RNA-binding protein YlxR (DUF448 family)
MLMPLLMLMLLLMLMPLLMLMLLLMLMPLLMPLPHRENKIISETSTRTCVGCRERGDSRLMLRFVVDSEGSLQLDATRNATGRGAWICAKPQCLDSALNRRAFSRSFRQSITAGSAIELGSQVESAFRQRVDKAVFGACRNRALVDGSSLAETTVAGVVISEDPPGRWEILDEAWLRAISSALEQYRTWKLSSAEQSVLPDIRPVGQKV